jgi:hypothetical protein
VAAETVSLAASAFTFIRFPSRSRNPQADTVEALGKAFTSPAGIVSFFRSYPAVAARSRTCGTGSAGP